LEHYCQPEAIQELKCSLCLPSAVAKCETINGLQGLALMGQGKFFLNFIQIHRIIIYILVFIITKNPPINYSLN